MSFLDLHRPYFKKGCYILRGVRRRYGPRLGPGLGPRLGLRLGPRQKRAPGAKRATALVLAAVGLGLSPIAAVTATASVSKAAVLAPLAQIGDDSSPKTPSASKRWRSSSRGFSAWLKRPVGVHPELLDHGQVAPLIDVGLPHIYRFGLRVGLLDVLTLGALMHWSADDKRFRIAPEVGLAVYRGKHLALGFRYRYLFEPTPDPEAQQAPMPKPDAGNKKPPPPALFAPQTLYLVGSVALSRGYFSVGAEAGVMRRRALVLGEAKVDSYLFENRWEMATGMFVRAGTPRWGISAQVIVPTPEVSLRFEWRFALFALAKKRDELSVALRKAQERRAEPRVPPKSAAADEPKASGLSR